MRIMKVNDNTVRIFISFTELADMDLSLTDFFQRSARSEQFFWDLLAKAREEVDFHLDQPFWIQAMVASEDEFVVTVMKQEDHAEADFSQMLQQSMADRKMFLKQSSKGAVRPDFVYAFGDLEDVIEATRHLPKNPEMYSALYYYEDEYYLALEKLGTPRKRKIAEAILDEYGESIIFKESFLKEHAEVIIAEDAVQKLESLLSTGKR